MARQHLEVGVGMLVNILTNGWMLAVVYGVGKVATGAKFQVCLPICPAERLLLWRWSHVSEER